MKIKDALKIAIKVLNEQPPERSFKSSSGQHSSVKEVVTALTLICKWAYKDLDSSDLEVVVHCKDCVHYKKYRKKNVFKSDTVWLCSLDKTKKWPEFYCKEGNHK